MRPVIRGSAVCLTGLVVLSACVADPPEPLPADFIPGAVYDITPEECAAKGGKMTIDGNGLNFCAT